jgi:hypothetical protein
MLIFVDRDSTNGSKVNGKPAGADVSVVLESEDEIEVGESRLVVLLSQEVIVPVANEITLNVRTWDIGETRSVAQPEPENHSSKNHSNNKIVKQSKEKKTPRNIFKQFDVDGDGNLDRDEVHRALENLGCCMNEKEFDKMFQGCDKDKNGTINYNEFKKTLYVTFGCMYALVL